MSRHTIHLHDGIAAAPEHVWAVLTDVGNYAEILDSVQSSELLTDGPYAVGTRWRESRTFYGHRGQEELEVTEVRAPLHTTHVARLGRDRIEIFYAVTPHNDGTTRLSITTTADMSHRTVAGKVIWSIWGGLSTEHTRAILQRDLADFASAARLQGTAT
jgi:hypothetical protein